MENEISTGDWTLLVVVFVVLIIWLLAKIK